MRDIIIIIMIQFENWLIELLANSEKHAVKRNFLHALRYCINLLNG